MEPFELALSQVNFEGNDLNAGPGGGAPLHSFSNLVSYDSDFKDGPGGRPVAARRVPRNTNAEGRAAPEVLAASFYMPYTEAHNGGPHAHAHLYNGSDNLTVEPDETARQFYGAEIMEDSSSSGGGTPKRRKEKVKDSFTGFTETVEALALQQSVIGNSNITPASADEVARVIAMTQQKMKEGNSETESTGSREHASAVPVEHSHRSVDATYQSHASTSSHAECSPAATVSAASAHTVPELDGLVPGSHGVHVASAAAIVTDVGPAEQYEEPDAAAAASREDGASTISSSSHQRTASTSSSELIPVPPDMITKVTERKGWLAGRSVVTPEQSRPRASNEGSVNRFATSDTAEKDYVCSPAGSASEQLGVQQPQAAQSEPVIGITEQGVLRGPEPEDDISRGADISGVEKLKGEYDFDTSSYLETMQTFTSLQKTNNVMLGEETGTARFSPPVKDPGMLHTDRRGAHGKADRHVAHTHEQHESLRILPDENLILPFHVPVDTSTPVRPVNGHGDGSHQKDLKSRSAKRQVTLEEASQRTESHIPMQEDTVGVTSQKKPSKSSSSKEDSAMEDLDQDITDGTTGVNMQLPEQLTAMKVAHNITRIQHEPMENSSMMVNVDDTSQDRGRVDDMTGDLSMGNSSTAAGDGADLNKSERAELYRLQEEVGRLRREKAHLEGKLEVLGEEAGTAIRERSELQSHLASMSTHLKSQENSNKSVTGDRNALAADLETLKQNRQRLELVVMDAQKLIEEKDQDLKTLHEDLMLAHAANERSQETVKAHRHELMARDETIQALKNKVAELYVAYQNSQQSGVLAENQIKSLESSVASLTSAKEWYQGQLTRVQDAKGELQQEITRIQGEGITALTLVERLKADNVRVKQQLAEQQQRALQEKELLARHLEAIESDMMEREAAFSQLQQDQAAMESAMKQEEERLRQSENEASSSEDLKKLQNELRRKQAQVNVLEHEQTQLVKRLTLSQESLLERDRTIDRLDQKYVEIELSYKNLQREVDGRDEEVLKLKNEKGALEVELASTIEEKKTFDTALHVIKDDMGRVEQGFRQLKQELAGRTEELGQARGQNQELQRQLAAARARLRVLTHQPSPQHTEQEPVTANYDLAPVHKESPESEEGLVVRIVQKENNVGDIQPEVVIETQSCEMLGSAKDANDTIAELDNAVIERLQSQRDELEKRLQESQGQVEDLREAAGAGKQFSAQIAELTQRLEKAERQYKAATEERTVSERHLVESKEHLVEMELVVRKLTEEKEALEQTLADERARLEGETANAMSDVVEEREAITQLNKENAMLRLKVTETEKQMAREIAKLRGKVLQVTEEYEARLDEERNRQLDYQAALSELNQRTRQAEELKEELGEQLRASEERFNLSLDEQKLQLQEQTQKLGQERGALEAAERAVRTQLEDVQALLLVREETIEILRTKISEIEVQHREAREQLEESERLRQEEDARRLHLDLEREKGRLAGVVQSHTALKEHTTTLEAALARREASVAGLSTHVQGELQKRDKQVHDLKEQLKEMEAELAKEKQNVKDIKKQLMTEKGQHIKLRRQMETLWVDQDQVKVDLQTRTNQLNLTILDLEKSKQANITLKADVERLGRESYTTRAQLEELKRNLLEREQQDPLLKEQIQTLEWQLQQRTLEVDSLKDQLQLCGERQTMEVETLNKALQAANAELASVKEEMAALRQEKLALTTKVAQIKSALKATTTHNKKRREQKEAELTKTLPFDMGALERLLADTAPVSVKSKPLSFLKQTLSGLRGEISNLQHQVDQHTSAVQTSSQAWKALEGHVQELREVCKTSAAGRAAAHTGVPTEDNAMAASSESKQSAPEPVQSTPQVRGDKTPIVDV